MNLLSPLMPKIGWRSCRLGKIKKGFIHLSIILTLKKMARKLMNATMARSIKITIDLDFFEQMVSENSRFDSLLIILNRLGRYITNQCVFIHPLRLPIINLGELLSARVWHAARVPTTRGSFSSQNFEPFSIQMSIFSR